MSKRFNFWGAEMTWVHYKNTHPLLIVLMKKSKKCLSPVWESTALHLNEQSNSASSGKKMYPGSTCAVTQCHLARCCVGQSHPCKRNSCNVNAVFLRFTLLLVTKNEIVATLITFQICLLCSVLASDTLSLKLDVPDCISFSHWNLQQQPTNTAPYVVLTQSGFQST